MKKLIVFLMSLALMSVGCSDATESLGVSQEELACNYPSGSIGSVKSPSAGVIRQFVAQTAGGDLAQGGYYNHNTGVTTTSTFDWWPMPNVAMTGGWTGQLLTTVSVQLLPGEVRMNFNYGQPDAATLVFANGGTGAPFGNGFEMNQGVTKIHMGYNDTGNYRAMIFTGWHDGVQVVRKRTIPGTNGC